MAFTLIEILVVVGILALLVALLLPTLGRMSGTSMQARGLNTLKTLQQANLAYAAENDGWSVPVMRNDSEMRRTWWVDNPDFLSYLGLKPGQRWPASMLYPKSATRGPSMPSPDPMRLFGYNFTTLETGFSVPGYSRSVKLARVQSPSRTIAFADAVDLQIRFLGADRWRGDEEYLLHAIAYRHPYGSKDVDASRQRAAVVRWDGSAGMVTREEATKDDSLWKVLRD